VEDQPATRAAMASELEHEPDFDLVGQAASLSDAREIVNHIDVAILDLGLPDGFGGDLIPELPKANPAVQAIVVTSSFDPALHALALERGAAAVLDKAAHLGNIGPAVRQVLDGRKRAETSPTE
jgi:DNA-binding NarL/FixJ family response regulator